jgi:hypothetical protein
MVLVLCADSEDVETGSFALRSGRGRLKARTQNVDVGGMPEVLIKQKQIQWLMGTQGWVKKKLSVHKAQVLTGTETTAPGRQTWQSTYFPGEKQARATMMTTNGDQTSPQSL